MACGCKKTQSDGCGTCVNGSVAGATAWVDCAWWTSHPEEDPYGKVKGQVVKYGNNAVRTKEGSICEHFVRAG